LKRNFNYEGYKATFLLRTLEKHRLYLVSTIPDHYVENTFRMRPAVTVNSALQSVQRTLGSNSTISVIPNASRIIPDIARPTQGG
jgi:nickel-dependent lactate racemase